jgi:hypothetical protein
MSVTKLATKNKDCILLQRSNFFVTEKEILHLSLECEEDF